MKTLAKKIQLHVRTHFEKLRNVNRESGIAIIDDLIIVGLITAAVGGAAYLWGPQAVSNAVRDTTLGLLNWAVGCLTDLSAALLNYSANFLQYVLGSSFTRPTLLANDVFNQ